MRQFKVILFYSVIMFYAYNCIASPSVTSISGNSVYGLSFGVKSPAAPIGFYDFEDGVKPTDWTYEYGTTARDAMSIVSDIANNGTYSVECDISEATGYMRPSFSWVTDAGLIDDIYVYYKLRRNWLFTNTAEDTRYSKIKWCRFFSGSGGIPNVYYEFSLNQNTSSIEYAYDDGEYMPDFVIATAWPVNTWATFEMHYVVAQAGSMELRINGARVHYDSPLDFRDTDDNQIYAQKGLSIIPVSERSGGTSASDRIWADDIYIDNTQARVFVSDNGTLDDSTHIEIQIPTYWSDTSISVNYNQGSFANHETVYLFVVDSDGNISTGFEGYFLDGTFYAAGEGPVATSSSISGAYSISGACSIS